MLRVVPPYVSAVDDPVFEDQSILFALLDILPVHVLAAMKLFGVLAPLPLSIYKLGHILPQPILTSIRLYRLCASTPVPNSRNNT
jgi:hypothetical protein